MDLIAISSLVISGLALTVSCFAILQSRKAYLSSTIPRISVRLEDEKIQGSSILQVQIHNSNNELTALDLNLSIKIRPKRDWWLASNTEYLYDNDRLNYLEPRAYYDSVSLEKQKSIVSRHEYFEALQHGAYDYEDIEYDERLNEISVFVLRKFNTLEKAEDGYIRVSNPNPLYVYVNLSYIPGIYKGKRLKISQIWALEPIQKGEEGPPSDMLSNWFIRDATLLEKILLSLPSIPFKFRNGMSKKFR
jgi:hypothetical protein